MKVKDVMTKGVETINPTDTVQFAAEKMDEINTGFIPINDGNKTLGLVTDRDITIRVVAKGQNPNKVKVSDIMTDDPIFCKDDMDVSAASDLMKKNQVRRLLVTDSNDKLTGVVSLGDIAVHGNKEEAKEALHEVAKPAEPEK
ncbi:MAG: CBS domain-containing protein [Bacteroidota bacterium]